jgi:hypothetical protein
MDAEKLDRLATGEQGRPAAGELDRLAAEASRADYRSMARRARRLYESGADVRTVLRRCYDFDLPDEFYAIANEPEFFDDDVVRGVTYVIPLVYSNQPWQLAIPLERGGPDPEPDIVDERERWLFGIDPMLLPLLDFTGAGWQPNALLYCYHLEELRAGRTTVFGVTLGYDGRVPPVRVSDSLLAALRELFGGNIAELEREMAQEYNKGAGSVDPDEVDVARRWLERVDRIRRRLNASPGLSSIVPGDTADRAAGSAL